MTDWNRERRFQGHVDVPLNAQGRAQAQALAHAVAGVAFDYAVSSDLSRAYETAQIIRAGEPPERDTRWREMDFGQWEGKTWEQIVERWPDAGAHGRTAAMQYAPPGGETFALLLTRASAALDDLRTSGHKRILVVTHAGPLHAMLAALFAGVADSNQVPGVTFQPAGLTRIAVEERARIITLNDCAHLRTLDTVKP